MVSFELVIDVQGIDNCIERAIISSPNEVIQMDSDIQIYRKLQQHLDRMPIGFPATDSGVEIRILKHLFVPEEARLATHLSMIPEPLKRIYKRVRGTGISITELEQALDHLVEKGCIFGSKKDGEKLYSNAMLAIGMFEFQVERLTEEFVKDMWQYTDEAFGQELYRTKIPQLRTIPVQKSIPLPDKYAVDTYDNIRQIVENFEGQIAVANCICRQAKDIMGESCTKTDLRESCIIVIEAEYYINLGLGRPASKDEVMGILDKAQEAGLVIQPENTQKPEFICCCCGDCCGILTTVKKYPRPRELYATNYHSKVNEELCNGCETCVDGCQLEAIKIIDGIAVVDLNRCIGCGNCAANCPANAIELERNEKQSKPPKNTESLYVNILSNKIGRWNTLKIGIKNRLGLKV